MAKKSSSIAEYISWLLQQYNEVKKQTSPPTLYRLIEIKKKENNQYELSFQIIGKAAIFKTRPEDVLKNEKFIEYFSSKDIHIITQLAYEKLNRPTNTIVSKSFSEKLNTLLFKIAGISQNLTEENTAVKLSMNKEFIKSLGPEDAHMIGYMAAQAQQEHEKQAIKTIRKNIQEKME